MENLLCQLWQAIGWSGLSAIAAIISAIAAMIVAIKTVRREESLPQQPLQRSLVQTKEKPSKRKRRTRGRASRHD